MIIECELIGGSFDGHITEKDTESEKDNRNSLVMIKKIACLPSGYVFEASIYRRENAYDQFYRFVESKRI